MECRRVCDSDRKREQQKKIKNKFALEIKKLTFASPLRKEDRSREKKWDTNSNVS